MAGSCFLIFFWIVRFFEIIGIAWGSWLCISVRYDNCLFIFINCSTLWFFSRCILKHGALLYYIEISKEPFPARVLHSSWILSIPLYIVFDLDLIGFVVWDILFKPFNLLFERFVACPYSLPYFILDL